MGEYSKAKGSAEKYLCMAKQIDFNCTMTPSERASLLVQMSTTSAVLALAAAVKELREKN